MKRFTLLVPVFALLLAGCNRSPSSYRLTSYKKGDPSIVILQHGKQTITAGCKSFCDEYGSLVGQELSCFVEPPPSDRSRPYETKRPIFNPFGGAFVCYPGRGKVFLVRHHECRSLESAFAKAAKEEYPEYKDIPDTELTSRFVEKYPQAWEVYRSYQGKEFENKLNALDIPKGIKAALWNVKSNRNRSEADFPEDRFYIPLSDLDKMYCRPSEEFHDIGADTVSEDGKVLPHDDGVEWLEILEAK